MGITTRSGKKLKNRADYYGAYAHKNSTLPGQRKKNKGTTSNVVTRLQEAQQLSPPKFEIPKTPPEEVIDTRHLRRNNVGITPYCSIYGSSRYALYPSYFFCSGCKMFDDDLKDALIRNRIRRTAPRYQCRAKHTSWPCPTETKAKYFHRKRLTVRKRYAGATSMPKRKKRMAVRANDESDDEGNEDRRTEVVVIENESESPTSNSDESAYLEKIRELENTVDELHKVHNVIEVEMKEMKEMITIYESNNMSLTRENDE